MSVSTPTIEKTAIDTIRTLSMDAVQTANSGHPGTPMALAPVAYQIWNEAMQYDPKHPQWPNRDRFVRCFITKLLTYANGEEPKDFSAIERIVAKSAEHDYRIVETIAAVIDSPLFRETR